LLASSAPDAVHPKACMFCLARCEALRRAWTAEEVLLELLPRRRRNLSLNPPVFRSCTTIPPKSMRKDF
jgi:hypothetical protein